MSLLRSIIALGGATINKQYIGFQTRHIKRWVAPTLREIRKRKCIVGPEKAASRSGFTDWNANAELFAFGKRLSEDFQLPILQQAFIHQSYIVREIEKQTEIGIESPSMTVEDNQTLINTGSRLLQSYVEGFVEKEIGRAPLQLKSLIVHHLLSDELLAKISENIGTHDLILSSDSPVPKTTLASTFKALVGALFESTTEERTNKFIHDFVCTQLSQWDYTELWRVENPLADLEQVCAAKNLGVPEPRLIGSCGTNTILASYSVGIYCNKKIIGTGFGETVDMAVAEASTDALKGLYRVRQDQQFIQF